MDPRSISGNQVISWVVLSLGLAAALVIGSAVGSSDLRFVAVCLAVIPAVVIFFNFKTSFWVILPISWYLTGRLQWIPLPLSVRNICFIAVILVTLIFVATRTVKWRRKQTTLDYLIYINLGYLVTVFVRHPAGALALQSDVVGGRPYFEIALAFGAFLILSRTQPSEFVVRHFPLLFVIPAWTVGLLDVIGRIAPAAGYTMNSVYSGLATSNQLAGSQDAAAVGETRLVGLKNAGTISVLALCAKYNPITFLSPLYPWRAIMLGIALGAIFLTGYRSMLLYAMVAFVLATVLRGQLKDLWLIAGTGFVALILLIGMQGNLLQLPLTMQRALSWLPGDWDPEVANNADQSTRWRIEMWEWAWNDDRIMRDRVWGQGFGVSIDDMNLIISALVAGKSDSAFLGGSDRESFMINGTFHSGPLSTIKYIGIVGLALYFPLMCYMAALAWRTCKRATDTNSLTIALFVGIPIIYEPFNYLLVFGALDINYPQLLFWAGLLAMTQKYVDRQNTRNST